jgi:hypothetical protein
MNSLITENLSTFVELLKQTPQLSSIIINTKNLRLCFQNEELYKHLNQMIKILDTKGCTISFDPFFVFFLIVHLNKNGLTIFNVHRFVELDELYRTM